MSSGVNLNPWAHEFTPRRGGCVAIPVVIATIAALAGVAILLAHAGVHPSFFNAMPMRLVTSLSMSYGVPLAVGGGAIAIGGLAWLIPQAIRSLKGTVASASASPSPSPSPSPSAAAAAPAPAPSIPERVEFPTCFTDMTIPGGAPDGSDLIMGTDRIANLVNKDTLVCQSDGRYFPANRLSLEFDGSSAKPYIISAAPDQTEDPSRGVQQQLRFYRMAVEENAPFLFSVIGPREGSTFPYFLAPSESINDVGDGNSVRCDSLLETITPTYPSGMEFEGLPVGLEPSFNVYKLVVNEGKSNQRVVIQVVPNFTAICSPIELALQNAAIYTAISKKYSAQVHGMGPTIVNCHGGKDRSAGLVMLLAVLDKFLETRDSLEDFVGIDLWDKVMRMAQQVEQQSLEGAGYTWANQVLAHTAQDGKTDGSFKYFPNPENAEEHGVEQEGMRAKLHGALMGHFGQVRGWMRAVPEDS